jgi:dynein heavy chain
LYFVIADLSFIDPMYQYSLAYFIKLFNNVIETSKKTSDLTERIDILINQITEIIYSNICRGLFNTHKLIFSFSIASRILLKSGEINLAEWGVLLRGIILDATAGEKAINLLEEFGVTEKQWRMLMNLELISESFLGITDNIRANLEEWKEWMSLAEPQNGKLPGDWETSLTNF